MSNPVVHWEITSKSAVKAQAFYASLFGWTFQTDNPSYAMVSTGEDRGTSGAILDGNLIGLLRRESFSK